MDFVTIWLSANVATGYMTQDEADTMEARLNQQELELQEQEQETVNV